VADGRVQPFDGDLDDYQQWLRTRGRAAGAAPPTGPDRKPAAARAVPARRKAPSKYALDQVEKRLAALNVERAATEAALGAEGMTPQAIAELGRRHTALSAEIEAVETQWLEMSLEIEAQVGG